MTVEKFPAWVQDTDATANKVDKAKEEADWKKTSIYHVPKFAKSQNPKAFTPQVFSFGPFHHGVEHLEANEFHKHRALAHFLNRSGKGSGPFLSKLRCILKQLQDSYQGLDQKWKENPDDFLRMMLLDGCFMIEVLRLETFSKDYYATNDPVFSLQMISLRMPYIKRDMLLLENQLPLLVLKEVLEVEGTRQIDDKGINDLVLKFCNKKSKVAFLELACHPLELYRKSLLQGNCGPHKIDVLPHSIKKTEVIQNVVELRESGVHISMNKTPGLCDIKFCPNTGRLELPYIPVHDGTEHLFFNMIAYEQIHVGAGSEIMSYVTFMDALIDTKDDVKLLQKKKIISNSLGSTEAVAQLFNNLAKEAAFDHDKDVFKQVRKDLTGYCERRVNRWRANLRHDYFDSPWKITAAVAASFAILLAILQTTYSALQFHLRK